jgi:2,3-bisphosphoglycerate-dependent phosphoglycerate mutase
MIVRHRGQRVMWLVRHAETNWNSLGWAQGQATGARLTYRGRRQALRLAALLEAKDITAVYSSDLPRALDTATTIADRLGRQVIVDPRLRERSLGEVEGSCAASLPPDITGISGGRVTDPGAHPAGGESLDDLHQRCADFVTSVESQNDEGDIVVVAHGGSIRMIRAAASGCRITGMSWGNVANASICRVTLPLRVATGDQIGAAQVGTAQVGTAQVGTAPTILSTLSPSPGRDPMLAASPKLNTPPSLPIKL